MSDLLELFVLTLLAGLAMPLGGWLGRFWKDESRQSVAEFSHSMMAIGGGALLSAVALVLVPDGIVLLSPLVAASCLLLGGVIFMLLDVYLSRAANPASQMVAMLLDFVPESLALGAAFAMGNNSAYLLAGLIALQNIPEGFNAFRDLRGSAGQSDRKILVSFTLLAGLGPVAAGGGFYWFSEHPQALAIIVLVAAGGILYSVFQDIAPRVRLEKHWAPPMGAVLGFMLGMVGAMLVR